MNLYPKQKEDLARAALHDGLIFSWDTGCGKTLAAYLWSLLKVGYERIAGLPTGSAARLKPVKPVLIVGPTDGFEHFAAEGALLGIELVPLASQADLQRLAAFERGCSVIDVRCSPHRTLPSAFYYTTYTQLTRNGVPSFPTREEFAIDFPTPLGEDSEQYWKAAQQNIGAFRKIQGRPIHCIYGPSLADLVAVLFDCVVVDEAVHMKGAATQVGTGIRMLTPRYRLVLTATPIKNRLPDVFYLAAWAAGVDDEPNARWPYRNEPEEQTEFAENFLIVERNLTKEREAEAQGKRRRFKKLSAEVCNVHGLWKLFAPIILRRRKKDLADIPPKECHIIRVPMGRQQAAVYAYHLNARYLDKNNKPASGAKLQALRVVTANPCSNLLKEVCASEHGAPYQQQQ